jgi:hypothetical protein
MQRSHTGSVSDSSLDAAVADLARDVFPFIGAVRAEPHRVLMKVGSSALWLVITRAIFASSVLGPARHAVREWLAAWQGPVLLGADANTPLVDAADFTATRTHWHTGGRRLNGEPGDDLLFGPGKIHPLDDGLRRWLADHLAEAADAAGRPSGPLAVTHRTGRRKDGRPGTGRRFDSIWITRHWTVQHISHLYDEGIAAGSDHAVIVADLARA